MKKIFIILVSLFIAILISIVVNFPLFFVVVIIIYYTLSTDDLSNDTEDLSGIYEFVAKEHNIHSVIVGSFLESDYIHLCILKNKCIFYTIRNNICIIEKEIKCK